MSTSSDICTCLTERGRRGKPIALSRCKVHPTTKSAAQGRLVYVAGLPDWPVDIAVTGSVWREGEPTPFLVKPNNEAALLVVMAVNEFEERYAV